MKNSNTQEAKEMFMTNSKSSFYSPRFVIAACVLALLTSCDKSADSFSLASEEKVFEVTAQYKPRPIDILWVIDNSGSMSTSQTNLSENFSAFISKFASKGYDFQMAVTTTDAYYSDFGYSTNYSRLRDGISPTRSNVYIMKPDTPQLEEVFKKNIRMGTAGSGDERALSSFKATLLNTWQWNVAFRRSDAFLAIIIVTDEEDFSQTSVNANESYSNPNLIPVQSYKTWLDSFTGQVEGGQKMYSVNSINIKDAACRTQLIGGGFTERKIAQRVMDLVALTGGTSESLCSDFADTLDLISENVVVNSTSFVLEREAIPSSIVIKVDGVSLVKDTDFFYDSATRTVTFSNQSAPGVGSSVYVYYDPVTIKQ